MKSFAASKPRLDNSYTQNLIEFLNRFGRGTDLLEDLSLILSLPENKSNEIIEYFLELACQSQGASNINNGRYCLQNLPKEWLLKRIENLSEPLLKLDDEWEFRRLLELYESLDKDLVFRLSIRAKNHFDPVIKELGREFLENEE